jgi:DNA repair protein RadA
MSEADRSPIDEAQDYFKAKYQRIEDLPGVGPATAQRLRDLGFKTVESIAIADPKEIAEIGEETSKKIIEAARKAMVFPFMTAEQLAKKQRAQLKLTTGCEALDKLMKGGIPTQSITEFYGEFGSGKSQICQQLCVTVQLPIEEGGLNGGALYIDTEQIFDTSRILQIARRFSRIDMKKGVLRRIIVAQAFTSAHQMMLLENCDEVIKENNIKLIVVDSLTSHFRSEYIGRENLAPRQQQLNKHLHKLIRLATAFNAAAVVTNQVSANPVAYASFEPSPIGGHILGHRAHSRIYIRKGREPVRIMKVVASPFLPVGEASMRITGTGIWNPPPEEEA